MKIQQRISRMLSVILAGALCVTPELAAAAQQNAQPQSQTGSQAQSPANDQQQNTTQPAATPDDTQNTQDQQRPAQPNSGTRVNPSAPPLQPVTTYPDANGSQQEQPAPEVTQPQTTPTTTTTTVPEAPTPKQPQEPVGAAAAQKVPTAGGAASKPAGAAIAPAKQHQTRSLLIKIGAIAAGGIAAGSVYALSRGTSSKPPGAGAAGTTQK
jgi:hypothetical protein